LKQYFLLTMFLFLCSFKCIRQSLEDSNRCPKCNYIVDNVDQLYPNFLGTSLNYISHDALRVLFS
jgi:hypothetical protein